MIENVSQAAEEAAAFQKIWTETMSKMMQAAVTFSPNSPPPEIMRQIRGGIFQALAQSWDEFMRSPQFLESMRQWMENAIAFRRLNNDFMGRVRNEFQAPSRGDIDSMMLAVRHMEKRLLDRIDDLAAQLPGRVEQAQSATRTKRPKTRAAAARKSRRPVGNGKTGVAI